MRSQLCVIGTIRDRIKYLTDPVLSGGPSGHVHGTAAYDITTTGEPAAAGLGRIEYESRKGKLTFTCFSR
jgi:hypothetical protein